MSKMSEGTNGTPVVTSVSPTVSPTQAAAKKVKVMLTDMERMVYDRCQATGDTPEDALNYDGTLHRQITDKVTESCRTGHILGKLENDAKWLQQQIVKLKAGVRERKDEPEYLGPDPDFVNKSLDEARAADGHSQHAPCSVSTGAPDA